MLNLTKSITISGYSYVEKTVENTTDGTTTYTEKVLLYIYPLMWQIMVQTHISVLQSRTKSYILQIKRIVIRISVSFIQMHFH